MRKGKICLVLSALIYGLAPILAKIAYKGGVNGITLTFLRTSLMLPLLFVLMITGGRSFRLTKKEIKSIIILGVFGGSLAIISLYASYDYISAGLATMLHFIYPLIIVVASALIYREKITGKRLGAVMLVTLGIFLFVDINTSADKIGVVLAILSGVFYSFFVVYMEHSGLNKLDYVKLTFYLMIIMSIGTLIFGTVTKSISFSGMDRVGWGFSTLTSFLVTLGAVPLFQAGVRYEGAVAAGIISALEPITTVLLGAIFLGEVMTATQYVGGAMIVLGVVIAEKYG